MQKDMTPWLLLPDPSWLQAPTSLELGFSILCQKSCQVSLEKMTAEKQESEPPPFKSNKNELLPGLSTLPNLILRTNSWYDPSFPKELKNGEVK